LGEQRRQRLVDAGTGLQAGLYFALGIGFCIVLAFVFLFGVRNQILQLVMTGLVASSMALLLGVIVAFDRPYTGAIRVSPEAWSFIIENNELGRYRTKEVALPHG
jgi:Ni/Fe-hydrogenase subunit HybB-like protein